MQPRAACQARLREARVVVIGLGGLGAWVLWALAAAGVGELVGVDGDAVELSNLKRQTLYREQDLGKRKALATARTLAEFNSSIPFDAVDRRLEAAEVAAVVEGADFVVEAADWCPTGSAGGSTLLRRGGGSPHRREPVPTADPRRPDVRAGRPGLPLLPRKGGARA